MTQSSEHTVTLRDGTALFYRAWLPATRVIPWVLLTPGLPVAIYTKGS